MNISAVLSHPLQYCSCLYNLLRFRMHHIAVGSHARLYGGIGIINKGRITIGNNFTCNGGAMVNPMGRNINSFLMTDADGCIKIGNNVGMSSAVLRAQKNIIIEDGVLIGAETIITDTDAHPLNSQERGTSDNRKAVSKEVIIRNHAFLGARCFVCKGVEIGENAVVGACSVVTKSIPANEIWAGNPAKFIRKI